MRKNDTTKFSRKEAVLTAADAARDAGYRNAFPVARRLLGLPRIQEAIAETFDEAGLSLEQCASVITEIALNRKADPSARLNAVRLRYQVTTGFSATKGVFDHRVRDERKDKFFDEIKMAKPDTPALVEGQD